MTTTRNTTTKETTTMRIRETINAYILLAYVAYRALTSRIGGK